MKRSMMMALAIAAAGVMLPLGLVAAPASAAPAGTAVGGHVGAAVGSVSEPLQGTDDMLRRTFASVAATQRTPAELREVASREILPDLNVRYMGASILGRYYGSATPGQRKAYFAAFRDYLAMEIGEKLAFAVPDQTYSILRIRHSGPDIAIVLVAFPTPSGEQTYLELTWLKNRETGSWQISDYSVQGLSFVTLRRHEWAGILREQGVVGLTRWLEAMNKIAQRER
ncbi:ABC transporter substrate-binding protein [Streptomyces filipinensis]|uniref:ABC transporter substrate-binding protein n=1 Tax=Streptomyces filipinensis TaxID=66887 RepID=UPI0036E4AC47